MEKEMLKVEYAGKQIAGLFDVAVEKVKDAFRRNADLVNLQNQIDERKKSLATILDALELNSSSKSFSIHR